MAYVIAVCGAGGKTTLCKNLAEAYAKQNKKVCITTTTNMWYDEDIRKGERTVRACESVRASYASPTRMGELCEPLRMGELREPLISYCGHAKGDKFLPLTHEEYATICSTFDYVIIEADGSRAMPMKIPYGIRDSEGAGEAVRASESVRASYASPSRMGELREPVIPANANEIIIVVGMESLGRKLAPLCHRFSEFCEADTFLLENGINKDTIVTEDLIDKFVKHYYIDLLKERFPNVKIEVYKNDYSKISEEAKTKLPKKICIGLLASGDSKRFGEENKLLAKVLDKNKNEIELYKLMIEKSLEARDRVLKKFLSEQNLKDINIDIAVATKYEEILNDKTYGNRVKFLKNENASEGMSSSIRLITNEYKNYDAVIFLNSDMPRLDSEEFARFIFYSILNKNKMAAMFTDRPKNPAYFEKEYFDELLKLEGDTGARGMLERNIRDLYRYYVDEGQLFDVDTKEDWQGLT